MPGISFGRALAFLVAGWTGLMLVASISAMLPFRMVPGPDLVLLLVLFVGLSARGGLAGVCALAFSLGYLADLFTGSPKGVHMLAYALLGLSVRAASSRLMVRGGIYTALVAAFFSGLFGLLVVALRVELEPKMAGAGWGALSRVPPQMLSTALFAPLVFRALRRLDALFTRDPRALAHSP